MADPTAYGYEKKKPKEPTRHGDGDGRGTGDATTQSTNGTDPNYKDPPDRDCPSEA